MELRCLVLALLPLAAGHGSASQGDVVEAALVGAMKAANAFAGTCGTSAVDMRAGYEAATSMRPMCYKEQYTNCTLSYRQLRCPDECSYVAPNPSFPCIFTCVAQQDCAKFSPGRSLPNSDIHVCEPCKIAGCQFCESHQQCAQCFEGFMKTDGQCVFYLDSNGVTSGVLNGLIVLIVMLVVMVIALYCRGDWHNPSSVANLRNMLEARRHRHLRKLHLWDHSSSYKPRLWLDLSANLLEDDIIGVGVGLYYKRIVHVFLCALVCTIGLWWLYAQDSNLKNYLPVRQAAFVTMMEKAFVESSADPAVLWSALGHCDQFTRHGREEALRDFAQNCFRTLCALFVIVFALSLHQSCGCVRFVHYFDASNADCSDYALLLTGLPAHMTDEDKMKKDLQELFKNKLAIQLKGIGTSNCVHGVSIAYDYSDLRQEVETMLSNLTKAREMELQSAVTLADTVGYADEAKHYEEEHQRVLQQDKEQVQSWFSKGQMKSTGRAFIIFHDGQSRDLVRDAFRDDSSLLVGSPFPDAEMEDVDFDPVSVFWENQANTSKEVFCNASIGAVKVIMFFILANLLVIFPYNYYVVGPFNKSGQIAGGPSQVVAGLLLGLVNQQIGAKVYDQANFCGFKKKERSDTFIFVLNTSVQLFNTWLGLAVTAWASLGKEGGRIDLLIPLVKTGNLGLETTIGESFYNMHVPGGLYVNYIVGFLMGCVVPFVQHTLVAKIIYVWRALPGCLLYALKVILPWAPPDIDVYPRFNAEKAIEAPENGIAWDYCAFIVHIATAFSVTAIITESVWRLFMMLTFWSVFYWYWSRFMHLRVQSASNFNGHLLDTTAWLFWGFPQSCLAGSAFIWAVRSEVVAFESTPSAVLSLILVMAVASCLWMLAYLLVAQPWRRPDIPQSSVQTVEEVMQHKPYTWYNCNPVYVLKCAYTKDKKDGAVDEFTNPHSARENEEKALLYTRGKEYLFMQRDQQHHVMKRLHDRLEFETYMEILFEYCHYFANCFCLGKGNPAPPGGYEALKAVLAGDDTGSRSLGRSRSATLAAHGP